MTKHLKHAAPYLKHKLTLECPSLLLYYVNYIIIAKFFSKVTAKFQWKSES